MLWFYEKHLSGVVSNLKPTPQYCFMITSRKHFIIFQFMQQKRERKLLMSKKQDENLHKQKLKFSNEQNR